MAKLPPYSPGRDTFPIFCDVCEPDNVQPKIEAYPEPTASSVHYQICD